MNTIDLYYQDIKTENGLPIEIRDRMEIFQGGPEFGKLFVDGKVTFPKEIFCGPMAVSNGVLYLVRRKKKFFQGPNFQLCAIELASKDIKEIYETEGLIQIDSVEDDSLSYYTLGKNDELKKNVVSVK